MAAESARQVHELEGTQQVDELGLSSAHAKTVEAVSSPRDTDSTCSNSQSQGQSPKSPMKWADMVDDSEDESDIDSIHTRDTEISIQKRAQVEPEKPSVRPQQTTLAKRASFASSQGQQRRSQNMNNAADNQNWSCQQNAWGGSEAFPYAFVPVPMAAVSYCWGTANLPALGKEEGFTLVVRNIPNKYSRDLFVKELNRTGFHNSFDFVYVPIDPETEANKGYAFINFINTEWSEQFTRKWENRSMEHFDSTKRITVAPAVVQGFNANYEHYCDSQANRLKPSMRPLFIWEKDFSGITRKQTGKKGKLAASPKIQRATGREAVDNTAAQASRMAKATTVAVSAQCADSVRCCGVKILPGFKFCPMCGKTL